MLRFKTKMVTESMVSDKRSWTTFTSLLLPVDKKKMVLEVALLHAVKESSAKSAALESKLKESTGTLALTDLSPQET